jgi:hypothetical protein
MNENRKLKMKKNVMLYKYRKLYEENSGKITLNGHTHDLLTKNKVYFSSPFGFNDPFDTDIPVDFHCTEEEFYRYHFVDKKSNREMRRKIRSIGFHKIWEQQQILADNPQFNEELDMSTANRFRIFCLAKEYDITMMWSHYADSHKGICVGIKAIHESESKTPQIGLSLPDEDSGINQTIYWPVYEVKYAADNELNPPIKFFSDDSDKIIEKITTKSDCWSYEKEMRMILWNPIEKDHVIRLARGSIGEVIFGLNTPSEVMSETIKNMRLAVGNLEDINFYQMKKNREQKSIHREALDIDRF